MPAGGVRSVAVAGRAGVPGSGVSAVALTLTVVGAGTIGAVSVAAGDVVTPSGAALVFNPGDSVSNTALVALHADGVVRVLADHAVNLIVDVQGYFTAGSATAPGGFVAIDQVRVADTRGGTGVAQARVSSGAAVTVQAGGLAGVPVDASVVYANLTVLNQSAIGYLRTFAADQSAPSTGALDFDDSTTAQSVAIPLSPDGRFTVLVGAGGPVDLAIDIQGYFTAATSTATFTPAAVHLLDTRVAPVRTLAGNSVTTLSVAGVAGIPAVADGLGAVALNLRTVHPVGAAGGYLRLWPAGQSEPATSNVNYTADNVYRTDLAIIAPAADGGITVRNGGSAPVDLVIDVQGWFADPGPGIPVVESSDHPAHSWTPAGGGPATFTITDSGTGTPATRYSYHLDDDPPTTVTGPTITLTPPTTPGEHNLAVVATDRYGVASPTNTYTFNIGGPPTAPTDLAVTAGDHSADLTWTAGTDNGAPTLGYTFTILDRTTTSTSAPLQLGNCTTCTHFVLTGLDPTHAYAAQITAASPAGNSTTSTSGDFTATGADAVSCPDVDGTDDTCATQDITKPAALGTLYADYDQTGTDTDTDPPVDAAQLTDLTATDDPPCTPDTGRVGPWSCSVPDTSSTDQDPSAFGWCNILFRCYGQSSAEDTNWRGTIYYGWNTWYARYTIGSIKARITWSTNGGFTQSKMYFNPVDKMVHNVRFSATMFNGSPYARHGGSPLYHTYETSEHYSYVYPNRDLTWTYFDYNTTMYDHNLANQFNWSAPGYEGYWYLYVRSPVAHTNRLGDFARYRFPPIAGDLPLDTAGWGHRW
ncbi:MAG: hypothetical protein QOE23_1252 [Pseudonocardiales bacterium]|nr:hypothetical protein [Pseudonocardiales bacterium]